MDYFISSASVSTLVEGRFRYDNASNPFSPYRANQKKCFLRLHAIEKYSYKPKKEILKAIKKKKETPPSNHFAGGAIPYGSRDLTNKLSYTCYKIYFTIFTL